MLSAWLLLAGCTPVQGEYRALDSSKATASDKAAASDKATASDKAASSRPVPAHHRADGFVNSDGSRVNKPLGELLTWWWQRRALDLDALVQPARIEAAWAAMPEAWRASSSAVTGTATGEPDVVVTWLGHASVMLALPGLRVLCDPHFSARASPVSWAGPKRLHPVPDAVRSMGRVDLVLISHNHYDHLDAETVRMLARQQGGPPLFLVPLGVEGWFREQGIHTVQALDWWESVEVQGASLHFVPAHHWSGRGLWDRNRTLWGGWVLLHPALRFYFAGDTGWSEDFAAIARRFAPFDLAAIPVGAYEPRWFMAAQHTNPLEAVRIHQAIGSPLSLGIHWGTFQLTDEAYEAPIQDLKAALHNQGIPLERFRLFLPGQSLRLPSAAHTTR